MTVPDGTGTPGATTTRSTVSSRAGDRGARVGRGRVPGRPGPPAGPGRTGCARRAAEPERTANARTAEQIDVIADQPVATWLTNPSESVTRQVVRRVVRGAEQQHRTPVFVHYAIPTATAAATLPPAHRRGRLPAVGAVGRPGDGRSHAVVLVEPDSIAQIHVCERLGRSACDCWTAPWTSSPDTG